VGAAFSANVGVLESCGPRAAAPTVEPSGFGKSQPLNMAPSGCGVWRDMTDNSDTTEPDALAKARLRDGAVKFITAHLDAAGPDARSRP